MEKEIQVEPICVQYICDSCKEGEMIFIKFNHESMIHPFSHQCTKCGCNIDLQEKYPLIRYRTKD